MRRRHAAVGMGVAFAVGWGVGARRTPDTVDVAPQGAPPVAVRLPSAPSPTQSAVSDCEVELDQLRAWVAASARAAAGTAVPFPDDLPSAFTPAGIEAALDDAVSACGLALTRDHVDCSEYPCLAWFEEGEGPTSVESCAAWEAHFPRHGAVASRGVLWSSDGQPIRYQGVGEWAPGIEVPGGRDNAGVRIRQRFDAGRDRLMDAWDARAPTEAERRNESLAFWQGLAEAGVPGAQERFDEIAGAAP